MGSGGLLSGLAGFEGTNLVLAILGLGALVAFHEAGHLLVALWTGMKVRRYSIGFGPAIFTRTYKGVDYTIGAIPFGGFVDVLGNNPLEDGAMTDPQSYQRRPRWARAAMVFAGPAFNYGLAWLLFAGLFAFGGLKQDVGYQVNAVLPNTPAEQVGLKEGDIVMSLDGQKFNREVGLADVVGPAAGREVHLQVKRGEQVLEIAATPAGEPGAGRLGIQIEPVPFGEGTNYTITEAMGFATTTIAYGTVRIVEDVARMLRPGEKVEVGGPVEMVRQLKRSATRGLKDLLTMLAGLSVMLGFFNLLPIPPLDGSKLLMLGMESVGRREIPAKAQAVVQGVGLLVMLVVMLIVTKGDIFDADKRGKPPEAQQKSKPVPSEPAAAQP